MRNNYQSFRLKDLIELKSGSKIAYVEGGKYEVFGAGEKPTGYCNEYNNDGKITITKKGTVGRIYKREFKHFVAEASAIIEIKSDRIIKEYLYEWLLSKEHLTTQLKTIALIPNLDEKAFLNLEIKVPDLDRQYKVVDMLNRYKRLLDEKEKLTEEQIKDLSAVKKKSNEIMFFKNINEE